MILWHLRASKFITSLTNGQQKASGLGVDFMLSY